MLISCGPAGEITSKSYKCMSEGDHCEEGIGSHPEEDNSRVQGKEGNNTQGSQGPKGEKGDSCSIEEVAGGATITCGQDKVMIYNGNDGEDSQSQCIIIKGKKK